LFELLRKDGVEDPFKYIKFFSLRAHCQMPDTKLPMSEMIYIHSKIMIVDDLYFVVGSANLNDRSMLGSRDHEVAVVMA
jgi:phospholipase D1/2